MTVLVSNSPGFTPPDSTLYDSGVRPFASETVSSIDNFDLSRKAQVLSGFHRSDEDPQKSSSTTTFSDFHHSPLHASDTALTSSKRKVVGRYSRYFTIEGASSRSHQNGTSPLLVLHGLVAGQIISVLIDSGCELEAVLSNPCAERLGLVRTPSSLSAERWDGSLSSLEVVGHPIALDLGGQLTCELKPYCAQSLPYDLILGKEWLRMWNPRINWKNETLLVFDPVSQKVVRLAAQDAEKHIPPHVITATQLKRRARKGIPIYVVQINNIGIPIMDSGNDNQNDESEPELTSLLTEFSDVFPDDLPPGLPPERSVELKIDLEPEAKPIKRPIYKLSMEELNEVKRQIDDLLEKGFIRPSISPWGSSVLFVPKKDGGLRMCVDYRALNKATIRNNYPLPRIDEVWDQIGGSKYFTSLDLRSGYNQIRIAKEDTEKTCFRTRYGAYEFLVVPFGLAGAPPIFQSLMNEVLRPYLDRFCLVYLDDILIYSRTREEHLEHIRLVFSQLRKHRLYAKLSKCAFMRSNLTYLGHNISNQGISVEERKIHAINSWERPQNVVNVQSFLGLCNYYRRFVPHFARIAAPLTDLTKKTNPFSWGSSQEMSFNNLKAALLKAPVLRCADYSLPFEVQSDASGVGLGAVLQQTDDHGTRPVAYYSRKLNSAEQNYAPHEQELLAIVSALREWRCYLLGRKFTVKTDHKPLQYLQDQKQLSRRQARWILFLQEFDFNYVYIPGRSNHAADALSRSHAASRPLTWDDVNPPLKGHSAIIAAMSVLRSDALTEVKSAYQTDTDFSSHYERPTAPYVLRDGLLFKNHALCIPSGPLRDVVLHDHHDAPVAGHRGVQKTIRSLNLSYYWPSIRKDVIEYVRSCEKCQRAKASRQRKPGLIRPFPPPLRKWEVVSMDFVFDLPLTPSGNNGLVVIVDKLSRQAHFIALKPGFDAADLANLYLTDIFRHHGLPRMIISDRDVRFTSLFWKTLTQLLGIKLNLSTAYHPQTDGQSERTIGTFEEMVRPYVCYLQSDWDLYLAQLEFAYNNSIHDATGQTPFYIATGQHPVGLADVLLSTPPETLIPPSVHDIISSTNQATALARQAISSMNAHMSQTVNAHRRPVDFSVGQLVLLSTQNLRLPGGSLRTKKLSNKWIGPFRVLSRLADGRAYTLDLPAHMKLHPTFHVSFLKPYFPNRFPARASSPAHPDVFEDGHEEWEVESILAHRVSHRRLDYLVSWVGLPEHENAWIPESSLINSPELLTAYWAAHGPRPLPSLRPSPRPSRRCPARGRASS